VIAVLEAREPGTGHIKAAQPLLVRQFELLATAPDGVARLRKFILSLAVQGTLTAQDPDDEPASALLQRIRDRKLPSIASASLKQGKQSPGLDDADPMFDLPKGWTWVRLGELCSYIQRGKGPAYAEQSEHKVISQKCVRWYGLDLAPARFVTPESLAKYEPVRFLRAGDLLWNSTGTGTIGRACVVPIELDDAGLVADSHVTVVRPMEVNSRFLWRWIQSPFVQNEIEGSASGTTNQIELNTSTVVSQPVPLPPLAEQARIVDRVDELMRLCDSLEAKGRLEAEQHARLFSTLLDTLTDSSTPEELAANWQRVADHFDLLLDRTEAVDALEQTILQLAVRGLLVPQDSNDEPAATLLDRIRAEKDRMLASGKIKRDKPLPPVAETEVPFDLPTGWAWVTLDSLASQITDGAHHTPNYVQAGVPFLSVKDLSSGVIDFSDTRFISREAHEDLARRCNPEFGDLLLTKIGTTGIAVVVDTTLPFSLFVSVALIKLPPISACRDFLSLVINSPFVRQQSEDGTEGVGNKNLVLRKIRAFRIPLPPLNEQMRIVARVKELRRVCVELRAVLDRSRAKQTALADALIDQALVT
jgi:type I restriction enzyme S subunit